MKTPKSKDEHWSKQLEHLNPCPEALRWARTQPSAEVAWEQCERADWMLWVANHLKTNQQALVLAACACARTALRCVPKGELRPKFAICAAEKWAAGKATIESVRAAADDAIHAVYVAGVPAAAHDAAYSAYAAACTADSACFYTNTYGTVATTAAAAYAADDDARKKALRKMAKLVRKFVEQPRFLAMSARGGA